MQAGPSFDFIRKALCAKFVKILAAHTYNIQLLWSLFEHKRDLLRDHQEDRKHNQDQCSLGRKHSKTETDS